MKAMVSAPCRKCPFRKDVPIYLRSGRRAEIAEHLLGGGHFDCHETTTDDGEGGMSSGPDAKMCAGAHKALAAVGGSSQMARIAERLGMADLDRVEHQGAEVWDLREWPKLAEGSTGDEPEFVKTCSVVGPGCEAPAGYMTGSGGVQWGTVAADNECRECGEPACGTCMADDGRCLDCASWGEDESEAS